MTTPDDPTPPGGWRCSRCGSPRPGTDGFCGVCGARMPRELLKEGRRQGRAGQGPAAGGEARSAGGLLRPLVLAGIPLVGVAVALLVARPAGTGPAPIVATPGTWRCGEAGQSWATPIRAAGDTIRVEWRAGGPDGVVRASESVGRYALDGYRQGDGTYVIPAADVAVTASAACSLPEGPHTLVVVDTAIDEVVAAGPVTLAR